MNVSADFEPGNVVRVSIRDSLLEFEARASREKHLT